MRQQRGAATRPMTQRAVRPATRPITRRSGAANARRSSSAAQRCGQRTQRANAAQRCGQRAASDRERNSAASNAAQRASAAQQRHPLARRSTRAAQSRANQARSDPARRSDRQRGGQRIRQRGDQRCRQRARDQARRPPARAATRTRAGDARTRAQRARSVTPTDTRREQRSSRRPQRRRFSFWTSAICCGRSSMRPGRTLACAHAVLCLLLALIAGCRRRRRESRRHLGRRNEGPPALLLRYLGYLAPHAIRTFTNSLAWQRRMFGWVPSEPTDGPAEGLRRLRQRPRVCRAPRNMLVFDVAPLSHAFETYPRQRAHVLDR